MLFFLQIILLIITTVLFHIGTTNPNISSNTDFVSYEGFVSTLTVSAGPKFGQVLIWTSTLFQVFYLSCIKATSFVSISTIFPHSVTSIDPLPWSSISILGYICMIVGGLGRIWCYKTLGNLFTFEITIRNSHKLIKSGPYAYVRHPSYTFASILTLGVFIIHRRIANFFPNHTWLYIYLDPVGLSITFAILYFFLKYRVAREEKELTKAFGREWIDYASKTKRFIPGII